MRLRLIPVLMFFLLGASFSLCNFGTMQPVSTYSAVPGATLYIEVYVYNIYGDQTVHTLVDSVNAPNGWEVSFEPEASYVTYEIPGGTTQIYENLDVPPMGKVTQEEYGKVSMEGLTYLPDPVTPGYYIPAKKLRMIVEIPSDAELWKTYQLSFTLKAWCTGGAPENIAVEQNREFRFLVKTVVPEYFERKVVTFWDYLRQNALYVALASALVITLLSIYILRRMGKLIIKVEIK